MADMLDRALAELDDQLGVDPEAQTEAPAEGGTPEAEPAATGERARDPETGQFVKQETETEPESEPGQETEPPADEGLIAGRFKSHEELEKAYLELDREYGRRGQEFGELRKEFEGLREAIQQPEPVRGQGVDLDELVNTDPVQAMEIALERAQAGDPYVLRRTAEAWEEISPGASRLWAQNKQLEQRLEQTAQQLQPVQQQNDRNDFAAAWQLAARDIPDLDKYATAIIEAAENAPEVLNALASSDTAGKSRVIANLYKIAAFDARQQNDQTLTTARTEAERQAAEEAAAAKKDAFVAAGSVRNEQEPISENERWLQEVFDPAAKRYMADE